MTRHFRVRELDDRLGLVEAPAASGGPAGPLKKTGAGNLFTVFGEPDIEVRDTDDNQLVVTSASSKR